MITMIITGSYSRITSGVRGTLLVSVERSEKSSHIRQRTNLQEHMGGKTAKEM